MRSVGPGGRGTMPAIGLRSSLSALTPPRSPSVPDPPFAAVAARAVRVAAGARAGGDDRRARVAGAGRGRRALHARAVRLGEHGGGGALARAHGVPEPADAAPLVAPDRPHPAVEPAGDLPPGQRVRAADPGAQDEDAGEDLRQLRQARAQPRDGVLQPALLRRDPRKPVGARLVGAAAARAATAGRF